MPKHKPIKFKRTLDIKMVEQISDIIRSNKTARSIKNATIALACLGGVLTLATVAPGVLAIAGKALQAEKKRRWNEYHSIWRSFQNLKQGKCFKFVEEQDGHLVYQLTPRGTGLAKKLVLEELHIKSPQKWDGYWRLVLFDVPEKYKRARKVFQEKLKEIGFYQCQKSAWVHPFPCDQEIELLKEIISIKPFVRTFLVKEMTDGKTLFNFKDLLKKTILGKF